MNYKRNLRIGVDGYTDNETVLDVYGNVNVSKNINVAGTITYDDVTNVDSIGLITARNGIQVDSGGINVSSGIVTAPAFTGFDYLQAPHGTTVNYSVTVAAKTAAHRYNGSGSGNGYVINGVESPFLTLTPGRTYRFTLSSSDMSSHPFRFYLEADRTTEYTTNVTSTSTYTEIVVTDTTPTALHYQCSAHGYMGNAVQINSNAVNTPYQIEGLSGANITGVSTFAGNAFFQSNVHLGDNDQLRLGDSNEFKVIHRTAGDSTITSSGAVYVGSSAKVNIASGYNTDFMARFTPAGSAELYNNYVKKFETTASGIDVTGHTETDTLNVSGLSTFQSHVHLGDDDELRFGASNDFKIVHDPNDCRFENSNGDIKFKNTGSYFFFDEDGGETLASFINDGAVNLYHAGSKKLETTGYGVTVFGTLQVSNDVNVVGVLTANRLYSNVYGEFTGGGISGTNITGTSLNISGISTLGTLQVSNDVNVVGVLTAERLYSNVFGEFTGGGISGTNITGTSLNISGISTLTGDVSFGSTVTFGDNDQIIMGDGPDLKLYHDGSNSYVEDTGTGALIMKGSTIRFRSTANEKIINAHQNGSVDLFYDNVKKFETTGYGVSVTGGLNVSGISTLGTLQVSNDVNVVGVLTAERLFSNVFGEFTGGGISGTNITGTSLNISGISTLGTLQISSGIVTATSGVITYYGDGSNLTGTNFNGASKSVVKYIATDGQTTFVASYEIGYVDVYLNGVKLTADLYTSTSGTSIILNDGAAANDVIEIISFTFIEPSEADSANNIANKASSKYTATNGQTSFAATYEIGYVDVYLNGVKLTDDLYDATSGSAVILNDGAAAGDIVEIIAFTFHNFNVGIQSGGSLVGSAKTINFNGSGISSVTVSSGIATININGINPIVANIVF